MKYPTRCRAYQRTCSYGALVVGCAAALEGTDDKARELAEQVINELLARGHFDYRELLAQT